jgi:hypothetical protein
VKRSGTKEFAAVPRLEESSIIARHASRDQEVRAVASRPREHGAPVVLSDVLTFAYYNRI